MFAPVPIRKVLPSGDRVAVRERERLAEDAR